MTQKTEKQETTQDAPKSASAASTAAKAVETIEAFETKFKPLIAHKVRAGLTREQAVNAIRAQVKEDAKIAEAQLKALTEK
jgi:hypothetical protein